MSLFSCFLMSINPPALASLNGQPGRERPGFGSRARDEVYLGGRLPFRSCFCRRLFEMDLLVHISDPIDRDEMVPAAGFRIVLAQYDAVGGLQVVDGANVLAVQAHNFHVLLNVEAFEHVSPPLITRWKTLSVGRGFLRLLEPPGIVHKTKPRPILSSGLPPMRSIDGMIGMVRQQGVSRG